VDTYGHLIPGANINGVDGLDRKTTPQQDATRAQLQSKESGEIHTESSERVDNVEEAGERGRNRTFNLLIPSQQLNTNGFNDFPKY
jgi:hypothetical protein